MERPEAYVPRNAQKHRVIGLGIIGRGVAGNLRRKGFPVYVWNRSPRSVPNFLGSPGELAEICNYIQIFVSDDDALLQTAQQLGEKLTPRHLVLAHSTVAPDSMRAVAEIVERRKARFVEAPFTGSKTAAEKGELVYYVCGNDAALRDAASDPRSQQQRNHRDQSDNWPGERHQGGNQHGHGRKHPGSGGSAGTCSSFGFAVGKVSRGNAQ